MHPSIVGLFVVADRPPWNIFLSFSLCSWDVLENLVEKGTIKCIGVSNFAIGELAELLGLAHHPPCLVQLNSEPLRPAIAEQAFCRRHHIQFEGYSSLGGQYGQSDSNPVLGNEVVKDVAAQHKKTPAQVVLRWALQQGQMVIPRSSKAERIKSNLELFDFDLTDDEMDRLLLISQQGNSTSATRRK